MNNLCRLNDLKLDIAGVGLSVTALDSVYVQQINEASAQFRTKCRGRQFNTWTGAKYFGGDDADGLILYTGDLLSVSEVLSLTTAGVTTRTLVLNTDFRYWPRNAASEGLPYRGLELIRGGQVGVWPPLENTTKVTGVFGFSSLEQSTGLTVQGGGINAAVLSLTASADASSLIFAGDTILLESEELTVLTVATTTITVNSRGLNGTAAATHAASVPIRVRRYPADIENAVKVRVSSGRWNSQGGYEGADGGSTGKVAYAQWMQAIADYSDVAGAF